MFTLKSYISSLITSVIPKKIQKKKVRNSDKSIRIKKTVKPQDSLERNELTTITNLVNMSVVWDYPNHSFIKADNPKTQRYLNSLTPFLFSQNQYLIQKMDNIQVNINAEEISRPRGIEIILDQFSRTNEPINTIL
jgi:hypothetical protein